MSWKVVALMLILVAPFALADQHDAGSGVPPQGQQGSSSGGNLERQNRFLAAEVSRQMQEAQTEMVEELKTYQDENFVLLDNRMGSLISDIRTKVILGGIGAVMVSQAIVGYMLMRSWRKYSYERFLEKQLEQGQVAAPSAQEAQSVNEMQQNEWYPQQPQETVGMQYGQQAAGQMSQMNQWQTQPAYHGAWQSPVPTETESGFEQQWPQQDWYDPSLDPQYQGEFEWNDQYDPYGGRYQ